MTYTKNHVRIWVAQQIQALIDDCEYFTLSHEAFRDAVDAATDYLLDRLDTYAVTETEYTDVDTWLATLTPRQWEQEFSDWNWGQTFYYDYLEAIDLEPRTQTTTLTWEGAYSPTDSGQVTVDLEVTWKPQNITWATDTPEPAYLWLVKPPVKLTGNYASALALITGEVEVPRRGGHIFTPHLVGAGDKLEEGDYTLTPSTNNPPGVEVDVILYRAGGVPDRIAKIQNDELEY